MTDGYFLPYTYNYRYVIVICFPIMWICAREELTSPAVATHTPMNQEYTQWYPVRSIQLNLYLHYIIQILLSKCKQNRLEKYDLLKILKYIKCTCRPYRIQIDTLTKLLWNISINQSFDITLFGCNEFIEIVSNIYSFIYTCIDIHSCTKL